MIAAEPDHGRALGYGAGLLAGLGERERAKEWIERGTLVDPHNTILHFNFVCALARLREIEPAVDLLSSVIEKASTGWLVWLDNDTDLDPVRSHPRFVELVQKAKERFLEPLSQPYQSPKTSPPPETPCHQSPPLPPPPSSFSALSILPPPPPLPLPFCPPPFPPSVPP